MAPRRWLLCWTHLNADGQSEKGQGKKKGVPARTQVCSFHALDIDISAERLVIQKRYALCGACSWLACQIVNVLLARCD